MYDYQAWQNIIRNSIYIIVITIITNKIGEVMGLLLLFVVVALVVVKKAIHYKLWI